LPPFVLCANGSIRRLDHGGSVVGLLDGMVYDEGVVTLDPGDILIAYSDGVTEPENDFGEFGEARLIEAVQRHRHLPLAAISQQVLQGLRAWIGEQEQPDDITLVLARQAPASVELSTLHY
jgi:sigma-B regulation protein RsbU (phosphoserine phosphatase)